LALAARGRGGRASPWIFIHGTDKVEGGLIMLFFDLIFDVGPSGNFSADALALGTRLFESPVQAFAR